MIRIQYSQFYSALLFSMLLVFASCSDDDSMMPEEVADGFFIVNEGGFGNSNTSLSFYDYTSEEVSNNIFQTAIGRPLGDQSQSMTVFNGLGYIVVQNSSKVEVIDTEELTSMASIEEGISSPRYFLGINDTKGYVTDWGPDGVSGAVKVVDLQSYEVIKTIATGAGPNEMVLVGTRVYVANAGGFSSDNTISIIDSSTDELVEEIEVGDNPKSMVLAADGAVWVASAGALAFDADFNLVVEESTPSSLSKIVNGSEVLRLDLSGITYSSVDDLRIDVDGNTLYFNFDGAVYQMETSANELPSAAFIDKSFYGLAIDPVNSYLIGLEAPDFSSAGSMIFYDESGTEVTSFQVGIGPNGCAFK